MLSMQVLELRGGYLYEHRPDVMPHGRLTGEEAALWVAYFEIRAERAKT